MRSATIGDDGRIYDSDGQTFGKKKAELFPKKEHRRKRVRGRALSGLGQAAVSFNTLPSFAPPSVSAYSIARGIAVSMEGMTFALNGTESNEVYAGRLVVSDRYPATLFRVSVRPATRNYPGLVKLAVMEGQGAGDYVEIQVNPDGSGTPALMHDFLIVPQDLGWKVEFILRMPEPVFAGKVDGQRASVQYLVGLLDQASYMMGAIYLDLTPVEFGENYGENFNQISGALGMATEVISNVGIAWDFGYIGEKALKILSRVGSDILDRCLELFEMLSPLSPNNLSSTTDEDKILAFQKKVNESFTLRSYWSALLARVTILTMANSFAYLTSSSDALSATENFTISMKANLIANRPAIEAGLVEKGSMTPDQARTFFDAGNAVLDSSLDAAAQNRSVIENGLTQIFGGQFTLTDAPMVLLQLDAMLSDNANEILSLKESVRNTGISTGEDLGRVPDLSGAVGLGDIPKEQRAKIADSVHKYLGETLLKRMKDAEKSSDPSIKNDPRSYAMETIRGDVLGIAGVVSEILQSKNMSDITSSDQITADRMAAIGGMNRATETPSIAHDRAARKIAKDHPYESFAKGAFSRFLNTLNEVYRDMGDVPKDADGKPKEILLWTEQEVKTVAENRSKAVGKFADALTQGLVKMNADGTYDAEVVSLLAGKRKVSRTFGMESAARIMKSVIESKLFDSPSLQAKIYEIISNDVGVTTPELSAFLSGQIDIWSKEMVEAEKGSLTEKTRKANIEIYNKILKVIGLPEATDAMRQDTAKMASWEEIWRSAAREGKEAIAPPDGISFAQGKVESGKDVVIRTQALIDSYSGPTPKADLSRVMSSQENLALAETLKKAFDDFKDANAALAALVTQANSGKKVTLQMLEEAASKQIETKQKLDLAEEPVRKATLSWSLGLFIAKIGSAFEWFWKNTSLPAWIAVAKANPLAGYTIGLFGISLHYGILMAIPLAILGLSQKDYNPIALVLGATRKAIGLIPDPTVTDVGSAGGKTEGTPAAPTGISSVPTIAWVAGAFAVMIFGKQLFPALGEFFKAINTGITSIAKVIPGSAAQKKAGRRGRPKGEEKEGKVVGRGRPAQVTELVDELNKARGDGDGSKEKKIISKLKRAAERGQTVPPGLWGYFRR